MKIQFQFRVLDELIREGFVNPKDKEMIKKILLQEGGSVLTLVRTRGLLKKGWDHG